MTKLHSPAFFACVYRHLYIAVAVLALVAGGRGPAFAQGENLKVDVEAGFSGDYRAGRWVPIFVTITNQPPSEKSINDIEDFKGQVTLSSQPAGDREPVQFVREVDVPKASSKRFILYGKFPEALPPGRTPEIRLNTESGKYLAQFPLNVKSVPPDHIVIARVTSGTQQISLPSLRDQYADTARYGGISPDLLADHWAAYDSADVILFSSWPAKSLRPEVVDALRQWVQMGGTLVFATGKETLTYADDESRKLIPVAINGTRRLEEQSGKFHVISDSGKETTEAGRAYIVCDATAKPGADVLLAVDGVPLIVREKIGMGQVVFFANDLQSDSRALEHFLMPAWQAITPLPNLVGANMQFSETLDKFQTLTGRAARPPNQFIMILICIIYTVIVGPLNFAILGKKKKLEYAWLTVPVIVMFFFFFIYGVGKLTKGSNDIIREVKIDRYTSGSKSGDSSTVVGAFVSNPAKHFFRPKKDHYALGDSYAWNPKSGYLSTHNYASIVSSAGGAIRPSPLMTYEPRSGHLYISALEMGTYDARNFVIRGPVEETGSGVEANITWGNGSFSGTIKNGTDEDFEESWMTVGNSLMNIGPLKKGESHTIDDKFTLVEYANQNSGSAFSRRSFANAVDEFDTFHRESPSTDDEVNHSNFGLMMSSAFDPEVTGEMFPPEGGNISFIGYHGLATANEEISSLKPTIQSAV
ncbi:MAG: DUF4350 domain-containing protein, partial [Candidatus Sumerlaeota bacterium]